LESSQVSVTVTTLNWQIFARRERIAPTEMNLYYDKLYMVSGRLLNNLILG